MKLNLSPILSLPLEAITQTIAILAKRGVGKTYTASVLAEEFVEAKLPFCVIDPTGAWWGLRVLADGKPGLPVIIIGGKHGDIPLESTAGKLIADLIVDNPGFYVLDLSFFDSNANQDRFATDFAERLYRRKQSEREPLHLFVDEADSFAPQRPYRGQERMLGAYEALARRGRLYGIGMTLISQRPAVINKNVLSQIEVLIALQTTSPHDRTALEAWAEGHGTPAQVKEFMGTLASLGLGEAWIWSPSWLELFRRVQIRKRLTFNSSATPKVGEIRREPKALAPVDIEQLRKKMAETIERVKTDDPKILHQKIAELKRHKCPVVNQAPVKIERIKVPMVGKRALEGLKKSETSMKRILAAIKDANARTAEHIVIVEKNFLKFSGELAKAESKNVEVVSRVGEVSVGRVAPGPERERQHMAVPPPKPRFDSSPPLNLEKGMGFGERKILIAIAQFPNGITPEHIAVLTGYKATSRRTYLQQLSQREYITKSGENFFATEKGIAELGSSFEPLPTGSELREHLKRTLPAGEAKIFNVLLEAYPNTVSRDVLMELTGYKQTSIRTYLQYLNARKVIETVSGEVKAADKLFEE